MSNIVEVIRNIARMEVKKVHTTELGVVTSVFPHSDDTDKDNYECNVKLKDKGVESKESSSCNSANRLCKYFAHWRLSASIFYRWKY